MRKELDFLIPANSGPWDWDTHPWLQGSTAASAPGDASLAAEHVYVEQSPREAAGSTGWDGSSTGTACWHPLCTRRNWREEE